MPKNLNISYSKQFSVVAVVLLYLFSVCYWAAGVKVELSETQVLEVKQATDLLFQPAFFKADENSLSSAIYDNPFFGQLCAALLALILFTFLFKPASPLSAAAGTNLHHLQFSIFSKGP